MKNFAKHLKQFSIILVICYALVITFNYNFNKYFESYIYWRAFISVFTYTLSIYVANTLVLSDFFFKRERNTANFLAGLLMTNAVTVAVILVLEFLGYLFFWDISFLEIVEQINRNFFGLVASSIVFTSLVYFVLSWRRKDKSEIIQHKTIASNATASFESLKNQLDPHFLFNSLNVLSSLIEENPQKAQEFTLSLSKIYRYVLEQKDKNLVGIEEELDFAKLYVSLLQMRFEGALFVNFPEEKPDDALKMIPLSLQLLLENAIKHNIVSEQKPLTIDLFFQNDCLIVRNNYQKKETFGAQKGIGLQNIISRYALVSHQTIAVEQTETHYLVKLPLISEALKYEYQQSLINK